MQEHTSPPVLCVLGPTPTRCALPLPCLSPRIEGLENTLALRRLILTSNRISALEGLSQLTRLEGLWLQDNRLTSLEALMLPQQLAPLPNLRALYLQNLDRSAANPVCRNRGYKTALLAALPNLTNLDGERYGSWAKTANTVCTISGKGLTRAIRCDEVSRRERIKADGQLSKAVA